jgi:hypothetical protein
MNEAALGGVIVVVVFALIGLAALIYALTDRTSSPGDTVRDRHGNRRLRPKGAV